MRHHPIMSSRAFVAVAAVMLVTSGASAALAEGFAEGRVMGFIQAPRDGKVSVYMENAIANTPPCSQDARRFAFDITTSAGRAVYGALLAAMHAKTAVHAHGNGTCDVSGQEETLLWVVVDPPSQ